MLTTRPLPPCALALLVSVPHIPLLLLSLLQPSCTTRIVSVLRPLSLEKEPPSPAFPSEELLSLGGGAFGCIDADVLWLWALLLQLPSDP